MRRPLPPSVIRDIRARRRTEIVPGRLYPHEAGGVRYWHCLRRLVDWYGYYVGPRFFWSRWYQGRWWYYDAPFARWAYWWDGTLWWRAPDGALYRYVDGNYTPYDAPAPAQVRAPAQAPGEVAEGDIPSAVLQAPVVAPAERTETSGPVIEVNGPAPAPGATPPADGVLPPPPPAPEDGTQARVVVLDRDMAAMFPSSDDVNRALRAIYDLADSKQAMSVLDSLARKLERVGSPAASRGKLP